MSNNSIARRKDRQLAGMLQGHDTEGRTAQHAAPALTGASPSLTMILASLSAVSAVEAEGFLYRKADITEDLCVSKTHHGLNEAELQSTTTSYR